MNKILAVDSYKLSHFLQYPPGTEYISSYIEPRGVASDFVPTNEVVNVGMQAYMNKYLESPYTKEELYEAQEIANLHGVPFNFQGWEYIINKYGGYLPLLIQALPEGTVFPIGVPQVQVVNTDDKLAWLTSVIETQLLRAIWYPSTVATLSREVKKICKQYLLDTADNLDALDFMLHDFGARGVSSGESAALGSMAHLVNFKGTDTLEAIKLIRDVYPSDEYDVAGFSIPAAEHSTITSWKEHGGEVAAYRNMINQFGGEGKIYAVVSDSYDIYHAVEKLWGEELRPEVLSKGGRVVIRPDSGEPVQMVLQIVNTLGVKFGHTINSKGYRVLNTAVRVIQGDGVDYFKIVEILQALKDEGWSVENVVFGMGGGLLQKVNRDSLKYAMKASAISVGGKWSDIYKDPITDKGKVSKRGRLVVNPDFKVYKEDFQHALDENLLEPVYFMNDIEPVFSTTQFEEIRQRAKV